jgi:hypothetical protein
MTTTAETPVPVTVEDLDAARSAVVSAARAFTMPDPAPGCVCPRCRISVAVRLYDATAALLFERESSPA